MSHSCFRVNQIIDEKQIRTMYQPIVQLSDGVIVGYEALSRGPENTEYESPMALIELAEGCKMSWDLDWAFRSLAIERATDLTEDQLLFINVDPNIIYDKAHSVGKTREVLEKSSISPNNIIFEITERNAIEDYEGFNKILKNYTDQGFKIAIDDAGAGFSGINRIIETRPHYIKLDMNIISGVDKDSFKQAIVKSFVQMCQNTNIKMIAEGIETKEELKMLIRLGVYAGQGYYLQKPSPKLLSLSNVIKNEILKHNQMLATSMAYSANYHYIGVIAEPVRSINVQAKCKDVEQVFKQQQAEAVCILDQHYIQGLVTHNAFNQAMSGQYGHAVYSNREIALIMDQNPLIVDYYTPIHKVAELAINRQGEQVYDAIIVKKGSYYYGLVSVKNLLQFSIEYERNYARELNPLTQLPGNMVINRVLNDVLVYDGRYVVLYFDLDNFKAYNDVYGFDNGDKIIKMTSKLILEYVKSQDAINSFVGHIGGDDFVAVMELKSVEYIEALIADILKQFDHLILEYYNEKDQKMKCIQSEDRSGNSTQYPLMTLSVAGLHGDLRSIQSTEELGKMMASIKKMAKRVSGSYFELVAFEENTDIEKLA
jgi:diguanylate cyclase (GGDEF)-like protein